MAEPDEDQIVMTPKKKTANSTTIMIERRQKVTLGDAQANVHVAGGVHRGIIVNKQTTEEDDPTPAHVFLEFRVYLVSAATGMHTTEARQLRFWFRDHVPDTEQPRVAQDFFKTLVAPHIFPRDYVGFIKKIMKLMQQDFPQLRKIEVEMRQLGESSQPPPKSAKRGTILFTVGLFDDSWGSAGAQEDPHPSQVELTSARLLEMIESAYPTPLKVAEIASQAHCDEAKIRNLLRDLQSQGVVKTVNGDESYTRVVQNENQVRVVKQMPKIVQAKQPTIAIITAQYCEKLAVDAMMENTETFVRYTTVGESNVYTLGDIGGYRVVSTKLPSVGHTRQAMIAAGSTTTRLLGTFQAVEFVILVGVGGGVPHYTDYSKHVRLGDVVVSTPTDSHKAIYTYCELAPSKEDQPQSAPVYETKSWCPPNLALQEISQKLKTAADTEGLANFWNQYLGEALEKLGAEGLNFNRPAEDTDKLYMSLGGDDVIEVAHPSAPANGESIGRQGLPVIHLGPIASGRQVCKDDQIRQDFASRYGILAFDSEFDAVVESVYGNRKDCYLIVRGISDYRDGTRKKEWQPYAALAAASFVKAVISSLDTAAD